VTRTEAEKAVRQILGELEAAIPELRRMPFATDIGRWAARLQWCSIALTSPEVVSAVKITGGG
jgi:hypothetical protein